MRLNSTFWILVVLVVGCGPAKPQSTANGPAGPKIVDSLPPNLAGQQKTAPQPAPPGGPGTQVGQPVSPGGDGSNACDKDCEGPPHMRSAKEPWQGVKLSASEAAGLKNALQNTPVKGAAVSTAHVHVDAAADGQLKFTPDTTPDAAHVKGNEPEVMLGAPNSPNSSVPVKLVATPAAAAVLKKRGVTIQ
jgi:hypothetical protein